MEISFVKMHGAGNDFVLIDDRGLLFPWQDTEWVRGVLQRRTGVGCDGLVLIQPPTSGLATSDTHFYMRFINPNGMEGEMCGNAARCVARFACDRGIAPQGNVSFGTMAGVMRAVVRGAHVILSMCDPKNWREGLAMMEDGTSVPCVFVDTGVPHVVVMVTDLAECGLERLGPALRHHDLFQPAGCNVDFVRVDGPSSLSVRTYERHVEAETLACGTGVVASVLVAVRLGKVDPGPPVQVTCAGGDSMTVSYHLESDLFREVTLSGPATYVYEGRLLSEVVKKS